MNYYLPPLHDPLKKIVEEFIKSAEREGDILGFGLGLFVWTQFVIAEARSKYASGPLVKITPEITINLPPLGGSRSQRRKRRVYRVKRRAKRNLPPR